MAVVKPYYRSRDEILRSTTDEEVEEALKYEKYLRWEETSPYADWDKRRDTMAREGRHNKW